MFASVLKESTAHAHAALEKQLVARIRKISTTADYIQLLLLMYGYYHPLEQQLEPWLDKTHFSDGDERRKAGHIPADIRSLGSVDFFPQQCSLIPTIDSFPAALGALYVLEGSTLGGKIIAAMIARQLNRPVDTGFSFFDPYGDATSEKWNAFREKLEWPFTDAEKQTIVSVANETFLNFKQWVDLYEPANRQ